MLVTFYLSACSDNEDRDYLHSLPKISEDSVKVTKIWDNDKYCSFTSLIKYKGLFFCAFREGKGHSGDNGSIRILTSYDAKTWSGTYFLSYPKYDLRDPQFSIMPDGRLMLLCGRQDSQSTQTVVSFLEEIGGQFSSFQEVLIPDGIKENSNWIWRTTWFNDICYGVRYGEDKADLLKTKDGINWSFLSTISWNVSEIQLGRKSNGDMVALIRGNQRENGLVGYSRFPFTEWSLHTSNIVLQGLCFVISINDKIVCVSRSYPTKDTAKTVLYCSVTDNYFAKLYEFPSAWDTSYAGLLIDGDKLLVSYYSSHISPCDIFLAEIPLKCFIDRGIIF